MVMAVKLVYKALRDYQEQRKFRNAAARLGIMMYIKLGRKIKKKGGVEAIHINRFRHSVSVVGYMMSLKINHFDMKKVMASFFIKRLAIQELIEKFNLFKKQINMIIRRIQCRPLAFKAKHDALASYFDRVKNEIVQKVLENNDQSMMNFATNAQKILPEVRDAAITFYLRKCDEKYRIAFF